MLVEEVFRNGFSQHYGEDETLLPVSSTEENSMKSLIRIYLPNLHITDVKKVQNNFLTGMYNLKKEEYKSRNICVVERTMFHATSACKVDSIIQNNLDWRRVTRGKFGNGVSFSPDADYANCHSNRLNGANRAFIVAKVLVGASYPGSQNLLIPPGGYDTSKDGSGRVVVKYNDNEFLPEYVVYYTCHDISTSKYYGRRRRYNSTSMSGLSNLLEQLGF